MGKLPKSTRVKRSHYRTDQAFYEAMTKQRPLDTLRVFDNRIARANDWVRKRYTGQPWPAWAG